MTTRQPATTPWPTGQPPAPRAPYRARAGGSPAERRAYLIAAVLFASGLVHVGVLLATGRTWIGPVSLRKAATFGLSFGLTLASVTWATSFVRLNPRTRAVLLGLFTLACAVETALVTMQAWRGVPSHFNFETGFDTAVSMSLAAGGFVIIGTAFAFTVAALRAAGPATPSMRLAVRYGLLILLVALGTGAAMIADGVAKARGGQQQLAYTTAGSLKPLHAVAMHAVLVLPALAWVLRFTRWSERRRLGLVWLGIGGYTTLTAVVAAESIARIDPLAAPPAPTAVCLLAVLALVSAGVAALRGLPRPRTSGVPRGE